MYNRIFSVAIVVAAVAAAQSTPQSATIVGAGNPNGGQCTISVLVDGQAEIEFRGSTASMHDLGGAPPQWRRFECTSAMPPNPAHFQFAGLNGRGHQNLTAEPRNGSPAVVRIEDSEGGASEYTFRLTWGDDRGGQDRGPSAREDRGFDDNGDRQGDHRRGVDGYHNDRDGFFRGNNGRAILFQRVGEDLDRATSDGSRFVGNRYRLARTRRQLDELQSKLARGSYDERELNEVMGSLRRIVDSNRLAPRDRNILAEDLKQLDDFRVRHENYGAH